MKLNLLVPVLLSLIAAPAFAHIPDEDEDGPWPPLEQEEPKDAQAGPKLPADVKPPAKREAPGTETPTPPAPAQPKKP